MGKASDPDENILGELFRLFWYCPSATSGERFSEWKISFNLLVLGSSTDIGTCLSKVVIRHRDVGIKLGEWVRFEISFKKNTFLFFNCRDLSNGLEHIQIQTSNCKTGVIQLDKDHGKQLKKMRSVMNKRSGSLVKLDKKIKEKIRVSYEYSQKKEN